MTRLGIIGGSAFLGESPPPDTEPRSVETARGVVRVHEGDAVVFLSRHGHDGYRPPHRVRHHAHALALEAVGVERAAGFCSVGALRPELAPGTAVVPEDYLSLAPPPTFAGDERLHVVPELDPGVRSLLLGAALETDGPVHDGGVYAQTRGPRFETRAEVRLLADYADVVGMTAASEATLLQERGIAYALLGMVDNLAHGLGDDTLSLEAFDARVAENRGRTRGVLRELRRRAAAGPGGSAAAEPDGGGGGAEVGGSA